MLKNLLLLSAFSTFVVIVLIGLDVYHKFTVSTLEPSTQDRIIPIDPDFDSETLEKLKERAPIQVDLLQKSSVISEDSREGSAQSSSPTPPIQTSPIASGEGSLELSQQ